MNTDIMYTGSEATPDVDASSMAPTEYTPPQAQPPRSPVQPLSPLTHIAIFTAILAPIALLPYLAVRRHLISLHLKVTEVGVANAALQRDLKTALLEASIRREEHDRLRTTIGELRRDLEKVRVDGGRYELMRARSEEKMKRDIQDLMEEKQKTRDGLEHLRDLSSSLADIAAFMHEVEVQQGFVSRKNDGRGIDKIRQLAYRLQRMAVNEKKPESTQPKSPTESSEAFKDH
ncbi:hypothetical protein BDY19DRAFT_973466 [Irpex rosettiformis]|uniref:Uncharacterized protein n=1 Tax=Irpex rosettiformis TaxID=378272 RepID=A0ACB8TQ76_9APHY|nr:hypothetical protein BDY19DRAFT_973466 [Irpex rosettiformis]